MKLLGFLAEFGPSPMRALADASGSSATNVTKLVDALEAEGLLERTASSEDRRVTLLRVTPRGRRAVEGAWQAYEEAASAVFATMPRARQEDLLRGVRALLESLEEHRD